MANRLVRFTGSANDAFLEARQEAFRLGHGYVGVDHLLMGLMREQMGMAGIVLRRLGLSSTALASFLTPSSTGTGKIPGQRRLDLSPACKRAINRGVLLARDTGTPLVSTEHLLLGLLSQPEGRAAQILNRLGVSPDLVMNQIEESLDDLKARSSTPAALKGPSLEERFQIQSVVGVGSSSTVYRAQDLSYTGIVRTVALKEMRSQAGDEAGRAAAIASFRAEARLLAALKHPFIPRFYDFLASDDRLYIVMEFVDGPDLESILLETRGLLPVAKVLHWGIQLCDVLAYLHAREPTPIVFRDLKPSNVLIDRQNNIRLIDFNIARVLDAHGLEASTGTPGYSPPEQYHGELSPAVDVYALGATLHHLLTGQDPRLSAEFSFENRPIRKVNKDVNARLEAVVQTALAYQAEARFSSVQSFRTALLNAQSS